MYAVICIREFLHHWYFIWNTYRICLHAPWWRHQMEICPLYWPNVRSTVNSPHKGQWCGALMFSLINSVADLKRQRAYYDVTVMPEYFWLLKRIFLLGFSGVETGICKTMTYYLIRKKYVILVQRCINKTNVKTPSVEHLFNSKYLTASCVVYFYCKYEADIFTPTTMFLHTAGRCNKNRLV